MTRFRLIFLSATMSFAPAMADDIGDSGYVEDEAGDEGASDTDDSAKDEGCMAAAVNPTTALSVGLGVALLLGLRRRD
jgi:hypothetical protein